MRLVFDRLINARFAVAVCLLPHRLTHQKAHATRVDWPRSGIDGQSYDAAACVPVEMQAVGARCPELKFIRADGHEENPMICRKILTIPTRHVDLEAVAGTPDLSDGPGRKLVSPKVPVQLGSCESGFQRGCNGR